MEELARDAMARPLERRAWWQKIIGGLLILSGLVLTAVSFMDDALGGSHTIWYGAVIAGGLSLWNAHKTERAIDRLLSRR